MPGHGKAFAHSLLLLVFNGTPIANIADNAASAPLADLYVSLHTADPLSTGDQTSHECTYTGYARVTTPRSGSGWTVVDNTLVPFVTLLFPVCSGGSEIATHFVIGTDLTGVGRLLYFGNLDPTIAISTTVRPEIRSSSSIQEN